MKAGKPLALEEPDGLALLGQQGRYGRPGGAPADDNDIGIRPSTISRGVPSIVEGRDSGLGYSWDSLRLHDESIGFHFKSRQRARLDDQHVDAEAECLSQVIRHP